MANTSAALTLGDAAIRLHDGLFSLNDLHVAAGGERRHRPGYFLASGQTKALISEIETAGNPAVRTEEGANGGTYACRELVIAYAAWISPAFHLRVIRVFLAGQAPQQTAVAGASAAQRTQKMRLTRSAILGVLGERGMDAGALASLGVASLRELVATLHPDAQTQIWADVNQRVEQGMLAYAAKRPHAVRQAVLARPAIDVQASAARWLLVQQTADGTPPAMTPLPDAVQVGTWGELAEVLRAGKVSQADALNVAEAASRAAFIAASNSPKGEGERIAAAIRQGRGSLSVADLHTIAVAATQAQWMCLHQAQRHTAEGGAA